MKEKHGKITSIVLIIIFFAGLLYIFRLPPFIDNEEPGPPEIKDIKKTEIPAQTKQQIQPTAPIANSASQSVYEAYNKSMQKGDEYAKKEYYSLAINEYRNAASILPGSVEPLNAIGKIYFIQRNPEKAIEAFKEAISMGAKDIDTKINLGRAYLQNKDIKNAKQIFDEINNDNQLTYYYKSLIALYNGDYENAKNLLSQAQNGSNEWIRAQVSNFFKAFTEFSAFEGEQPSYLKTLIAKAMNQAGEYGVSIPLLKNVIKEKPDYRDAWILLGYAYLNNLQIKDAIETFEQARKLDPSKPETLFFLGLAYFADNKIDNAINYIESSLEKGFEPRIQAYQKLAELYFIKKDYEKSVKAYETVLGINSGNIDYFVRPMWIYIEKLNNPSAALSLAQTALIKHPSDAMAYNLMGWAYMNMGNYQLAKQNFDAAIKLNPQLAAVYLNMGQMYEKMEYYLTAKEYYKQAFELDKNNSSIGATAAERYNRIVQKEQRQKISEPRGVIYQVNTFKAPYSK